MDGITEYRTYFYNTTRVDEFSSAPGGVGA
nr:MAG TPA: hypothetical protein [Caudoviricetes sp.]